MSFLDKLEPAFSKVMSGIRFIFAKIIGIAIALVFLVLALVCFGYVFTFSMATYKGKDAKIISVSKSLGKHKTSCRVGGLFKVDTQTSVGENISKDSKIYCMYPSWPDQLEPTSGDNIKVWPVKKPLVGAPMVEGWGWFIIVGVFIFGLMFLEFTFLSLLMR